MPSTLQRLGAGVQGTAGTRLQRSTVHWSYHLSRSQDKAEQEEGHDKVALQEQVGEGEGTVLLLFTWRISAEKEKKEEVQRND